MYIEIRVQWTINLGSSHMHVHAVTRVHAVTPKLVICVMYLTSIWRILLMTDGLNAVWSNDRAAHTDTNPKNLELAPPQSITATRLDQLVYSPNYYIQIFQTIARSENRTFTLRALCLGRLPLRHRSYTTPPDPGPNPLSTRHLHHPHQPHHRNPNTDTRPTLPWVKPKPNPNPLIHSPPPFSSYATPSQTQTPLIQRTTLITSTSAALDTIP